MSNSAIEVIGLTHRYGERTALDEVTLRVERGEVFGLLGPNGSGKTTMFRILSTLLRPSAGRVEIFSHDLASEPEAVRRLLGVVFQRPSLDPKLTVGENLRHHARLYGLRGAVLRERCAEMAARLGVDDRLGDRVETLSGGLQRRVELAKGLLHRPRLLLLDEPSTGLDPAARREFMRQLHELRERDGVTVVLTTHYMEEAERCDRVAIMDEGRLLAVEAPQTLKERVGGDVVVIEPRDAASLRAEITRRFSIEAQLVDGMLRVERPRGHEFIRELVDEFPAEVRTVSFGKPTLEDAFIQLTGHRLWAASEDRAA